MDGDIAFIGSYLEFANERNSTIVSKWRWLGPLARPLCMVLFREQAFECLSIVVPFSDGPQNRNDLTLSLHRHPIAARER
jgi:hypothetical protein